MSEIDKRVKLVMARSILFDPWGYRLKRTPVVGLYKTGRVSGQTEHLPACKFKIIHIVILFIKIGRHSACSLSDTQISKRKLPCIHCSDCKLISQCRIKFPEDLRAKSKG